MEGQRLLLSRCFMIELYTHQLIHYRRDQKNTSIAMVSASASVNGKLDSPGSTLSAFERIQTTHSFIHPKLSLSVARAYYNFTCFYRQCDNSNNDNEYSLECKHRQSCDNCCASTTAWPSDRSIALSLGNKASLPTHLPFLRFCGKQEIEHLHLDNDTVMAGSMHDTHNDDNSKWRMHQERSHPRLSDPVATLLATTVL